LDSEVDSNVAAFFRSPRVNRVMSTLRSPAENGPPRATGDRRFGYRAPAPRSFASPSGVTITVVGSWLAAAAVYGPTSDVADKGGQLLLSVALVLVLSAFHEMGHAVAGRIAGLRFRSLTVGPFSLVRRVKRLRLLPNRRWIRFAGCVEHDLKPGQTRREDLAFSALGGPAANLLLASSIFASGTTSATLGDLAVWSCFFGVFNLVPMRINGQTSDGGLVLRCLGSKPEDAEWRARAFGDPGNED
jgi:Zn-dependent protease